MSKEHGKQMFLTFKASKNDSNFKPLFELNGVPLVPPFSLSKGYHAPPKQREVY